MLPLLLRSLQFKSNDKFPFLKVLKIRMISPQFQRHSRHKLAQVLTPQSRDTLSSLQRSQLNYNSKDQTRRLVRLQWAARMTAKLHLRRKLAQLSSHRFSHLLRKRSKAPRKYLKNKHNKLSKHNNPSNPNNNNNHNNNLSRNNNNNNNNLNKLNQLFSHLKHKCKSLKHNKICLEWTLNQIWWASKNNNNKINNTKWRNN